MAGSRNNLDKKFMRRALQLAGNGEGRVSPNPMVGAVIAHGDRVIGEGFHAFYGGPHAEVNAIRSVNPKDRDLLKNSTLYVTLEPCAHHGKTPPCANLIVETGIPKVVIGSPDPNPLVAGKGVEILKNAGIDVKSGILREECDALNKRFITAHTLKRPWIILKWAQSADGFMAEINDEGEKVPVKFSTLLSSVFMHRERASCDAILVGKNTELTDHPLLNVRLWGGNSPKKFVAYDKTDIKEFTQQLFSEGISSLMVEGGAKMLESFIMENLFDEIRIEISPKVLGKGLKAPKLPDNIRLKETKHIDGNLIEIYGKAPIQ